MEQPIQYIAKLGVPVDSHAGAGAYCSDTLSDLSSERYSELVKEMTGHDITGTRKQRHMIFSYLVMFAVKQQIQLGAISFENCFPRAVEAASKLQKTHPYFFLGEDDKEPVERIARPERVKKAIETINGVERKKGWKSIEALKIMQSNPSMDQRTFMDRCIKELEMTELGARTYWYNAYEQVHGVKPPSQKKKKG